MLKVAEALGTGSRPEDLFWSDIKKVHMPEFPIYSTK